MIPCVNNVNICNVLNDDVEIAAAVVGRSYKPTNVHARWHEKWAHIDATSLHQTCAMCSLCFRCLHSGPLVCVCLFVFFSHLLLLCRHRFVPCAVRAAATTTHSYGYVTETPSCLTAQNYLSFVVGSFFCAVFLNARKPWVFWANMGRAKRRRKKRYAVRNPFEQIEERIRAQKKRRASVATFDQSPMSRPTKIEPAAGVRFVDRPSFCCARCARFRIVICRMAMGNAAQHARSSSSSYLRIIDLPALPHEGESAVRCICPNYTYNIWLEGRRLCQRQLPNAATKCPIGQGTKCQRKHNRK